MKHPEAAIIAEALTICMHFLLVHSVICLCVSFTKEGAERGLFQALFFKKLAFGGTERNLGGNGGGVGQTEHKQVALILQSRCLCLQAVLYWDPDPRLGVGWGSDATYVELVGTIMAFHTSLLSKLESLSCYFL